MQEKLRPIKAEKFLKAVLEDLEPLKGTFLYESAKKGHLERTAETENAERLWLQSIINYLVQKYNLKEEPKILDLGCGTGELTVLLNLLGFEAIGADIHEKHIALAKILAQENNLLEDIFVLNKENSLPFPDNSFDIILMSVVVEHLSNADLKWLLPELHRICNGIVYIIVPNRLRTVDDHTGLRWVPWMPRPLASWYVKARGEKYHYAISDSGKWDVYYRTFGQIVDIFKQVGFELNFPPDELVWPSLDVVLPVFQYAKSPVIWKKPIYFLLEAVHVILLRLGLPKQALYTYMNLIFRCKK